jgi:hypothetical protein
MTAIEPPRIETWFDGWSRRASCLLLAALLALMAISALSPAVRTGSLPRTSAARMTDSELYQRIIADVASGKSYYTAAVEGHRKGAYPLKPFFTVRLPTLATLSAALTPRGAHILLLIMLLAAGLAWWRLLVQKLSDKRVRLASIALLFMSLATLGAPVLAVFHDTWAGALIALSLALNQQRRIGASIGFGLAAALFRELAVPLLLLMACAAVWEGKMREAAGWVAAILVFGLVMFLHARALAPLVIATDFTSQGWKGMGGWTFYLSTMTLATPLSIVPPWLARMLIPLCLFGWLAWKTPLALRGGGLLLGFGLMLMLFSRPVNFYWGLLMTPLLLGGLPLAVPAVGRLYQQARPDRSVLS